jgi:ankyrin repeat protein
MLKLVAGLLLLCALPAWGQSEPLFEAVAAGRLEVVERLIGGRAAVNARNADGETPLFVAAEQGHGSMVELLRP